MNNETRVVLHFDEREMSALRKLSDADLRPPRFWLRALLRDEATRRGVWPVDEVNATDEQRPIDTAGNYEAVSAAEADIGG